VKFSLKHLRLGKKIFETVMGTRTVVGGRIKREIVKPLLALPRQLIIGSIASLFVAIGLVFVLVGTLRLVQHFWAFQGNTAWLAYAVVFVEAIIFGGLTLWRIVAGGHGKKVAGP
jgi:TRAP-type C4-dicarboxylate transport system permease small subunit